MKKILSKFDLFPSLPTFRAQGQSEVVNLCGSLFSIVVFGSFVYVFVASIINTINFQTIDAKQILTMNRPADQPISNLTIGVGIQFANLTRLRSIFELRAFVSDRSLHFEPISVFPCTRDMWTAFDDTKYQTLGLDSHMCVQRDNVAIYGEFGSPEVKFIMFNLSICSNATSPVPCASPAFISWFFANKMFWGRFIPASLIILDTGISATNADALTFNPYEKTQFLLFNLHQQIFIQTFIGTYEINTDTSFLPFESQSQQKGHFVTQCTITTIVNYLNTPALVDFYIFPSPVHRIINRTYGKFDETLSYVGGLYGIVISFLAFFLMSFNQYKYQLRVAEGAFSYKDGHLAREQDLNFGKYLKYVAYDWCKTLFCCQLNWKDCKAINEAREQAIQQIDVRHLLKRISHLQRVVSTFVSPHGQLAMYMAESSSLEEVKRRRNILQYCHKFAMDQRCPTIATLQNIDAVAVYGLGSLVKTQSSLVYPGNENQQQEQQKTFQMLNTLNSTMNIQNKPQQNPRTSLQLIQYYLEKYIKMYHITDKTFQISEQDQKAEKNLSQSLFGMPEQQRIKIVKKIPLGILYRLWNYRNNGDGNPNYDNGGNMANEIIQNHQPYITTTIIDDPEQKQGKRRKNRRKMNWSNDPMDNVFDLNQ